MSNETAGLTGTQATDPVERERQLRDKLGIPDWAERVMVVAESTHWDPDWVLTSREYYKYMVRKALERAVTELMLEPRRIFDVECIFFLRQYFERSPHRRQTVIDLVNNGQLRLTGSGITTPDTLLPTEEALIRDLLAGQQWLRDNNMAVEPRTLYLPDSFGHTPGLPSIAASCGIDAVAFTRIDGMYFIGIEYTPKSHYPRIQSNAERLMGARALDFFWTDSNGSRVLAHWNAFNYGHGDMIAGHGISRSLAMYQGIPDRSDSNVASKIEKFANQLDRLSPTPYLLLAMGLDFTIPLKGLVSLIDRYNEIHARKTGIFVVNAGLDDYFNLVRCHADSLEEFDMDSNPYFMGFYSSRLPLKNAHKKITDRLTAAETASVALGNAKLQSDIFNANKPAWQIAAVGNHHDFITGTGSNRVYHSEQRPWLMHALGIAHTSLLSASNTVPTNNATGITAETNKPTEKGIPVTYRRNGDIIAVESSYLSIEIDLSSGGKISKCISKIDGSSLLSPCGELISALDRGGMWRMGNEFAGGKLDEVGSTDNTPAQASIRENRGGINIDMAVELEGRLAMKSIWIAPDSPFIAMHIELNPRFRRSVLLRLSPSGQPTSQERSTTAPLNIHSRKLGRIRLCSGPRYNEDAIAASNGVRIVMSQPGAPVSRPPRRHFLPTFWPINGWAHIGNQNNHHNLVISTYCSTGISADTDGSILIVAGRNPGKERALGFVPFLGFPAGYREKERCVLDIGLYFPSNQDYPTVKNKNVSSSIATSLISSSHGESISVETIRIGELVQNKLLAHVDPSIHSLMQIASETLTIEPPMFNLMAAKPASDGNGLIFRFKKQPNTQKSKDENGAPNSSAARAQVTFNSAHPVQAYLCDALERNIDELPLSGNTIYLEPEHYQGAFITIRVLTERV